ncbi:matrix Gla -like isoform X1 [Pelobates cultripes]|uniref:Matrix Gla -like isoform X1 n=1 Tax=Pelobates cultripes TaxID=61616 RepID=A0AAD1WLI9_PELCU|nr:matrix Gla -like isoform X1 [Pelobates cultripes]
MENKRMKIFILLLLTLSAYCFDKDDVKTWVQDSQKDQIHKDIKIPRRVAHAVIRRQKRSYDYYERWYPRVKSPLELKMEQCENYWPCDHMSELVGFYQAYQQYFGPV